MSINLTYDPDYAGLTNKFFELRTALADYYQVPPGLVVPTNGATGALDATFSKVAATVAGMCCRASALLSSTEYFDAVRMLRLYNFDLNAVPCDGILYPTAKVIDSLQKICPSLFYVSMPNNPTGVILSEFDLDEILDAVLASTRVIIDRALIGAPGYCSPSSLKRRYGDTKDIVVVSSLSKTHGLVGERVGCIIALKKDVADGIHPFAHAQSAHGMQQAIESLNSSTYAVELHEKIRRSHEILMNWNRSQDRAVYHSSDSNFACIGLTAMSGSACRDKLKKRNIRLRAGSDLYIDDKFIRIDMGQPEVLDEFLQILDGILAE